MLYNQALFINEIIVLGDTLLNKYVDVKLLSNKINLGPIFFKWNFKFLFNKTTSVTA